MVYVIEDDRGRPVRAYDDNDELIYCRHYHCGACGWTVDVDFADYDPQECPKCGEHRRPGGWGEDEYDTLAWEQYNREQAPSA